MSYKFTADLGWIKIVGEADGSADLVSVLKQLSEMRVGPTPTGDEMAKAAADVLIDHDWVLDTIYENFQEKHEQFVKEQIMLLLNERDKERERTVYPSELCGISDLDRGSVARPLTATEVAQSGLTPFDEAKAADAATRVLEQLAGTQVDQTEPSPEPADGQGEPPMPATEPVADEMAEAASRLGERPPMHKCPECGKEFGSDHGLVTHQRIAHPRELPARIKAVVDCVTSGLTEAQILAKQNWSRSTFKVYLCEARRLTGLDLVVAGSDKPKRAAPAPAAASNGQSATGVRRVSFAWDCAFFALCLMAEGKDDAVVAGKLAAEFGLYGSPPTASDVAALRVLLADDLKALETAHALSPGEYNQTKPAVQSSLRKQAPIVVEHAGAGR